LHGVILLFSGGLDDGVGVINPVLEFPFSRSSRNLPEIGGILDRLNGKSSPSRNLSHSLPHIFRNLCLLNDPVRCSMSRSVASPLFCCYCL
jgi:hypothetical protein